MASNLYSFQHGSYGLVCNPALNTCNLNTPGNITKFYFQKENRNKAVANMDRLKQIIGKNNTTKMNVYPPILAKNLPPSIYNKIKKTRMNIGRNTSANNFTPNTMVYASRMKYLGTDLFDVRQSDHEISEFRSCPFHQLMNQWYKLHSQLDLFAKKKYIHGDIRSPNILFNKSNCQLHLIDYDMFDTYSEFYKDFSNPWGETRFGFYSHPADSIVYMPFMKQDYSESDFFITKDKVKEAVKNNVSKFIKSISPTSYIDTLDMIIRNTNRIIDDLEESCKKNCEEEDKKELDKEREYLKETEKQYEEIMNDYEPPSINISIEDSTFLTFIITLTHSSGLKEHEFNFIREQLNMNLHVNARGYKLIEKIETKRSINEYMNEIYQAETKNGKKATHLVFKFMIDTPLRIRLYQMATQMFNDFSSVLRMNDKTNTITKLFDELYSVSLANYRFLKSKRKGNMTYLDVLYNYAFPSFDSYGYAWVMTTLLTTVYPEYSANVKNIVAVNLLSHQGIAYSKEYLALIKTTLRQMMDLFESMRSFLVETRVDATNSFIIMKRIYREFIDRHNELMPEQPINISSIPGIKNEVQGGRRLQSIRKKKRSPPMKKTRRQK